MRGLPKDNNETLRKRLIAVASLDHSLANFIDVAPVVAPLSPGGPRPTAKEQGRIWSKVLFHLKGGDLRRALQALDAATFAPCDDETLMALQALHPHEDCDASEFPVPDTMPAPFTAEECYSALQKFPRGSTPKIIASIIPPPPKLDRIPPDRMWDVVSRLLTMPLDASQLQLFSRGRLVALTKPQGGIRPIAFCSLPTVFH